jgi:hypothetical protein
MITPLRGDNLASILSPMERPLKRMLCVVQSLRSVMTRRTDSPAIPEHDKTLAIPIFLSEGMKLRHTIPSQHHPKANEEKTHREFHRDRNTNNPCRNDVIG